MTHTDKPQARSGASWLTLDGNEAVASVAHRASEVIAIYPITPSSTMGELADEWSAKGRTNLWGDVPRVMEMQSEAGAAGAIHGALSGGALSTTFTASQGLLLMIPDMYKIAGELTPFVMHVAARALATHALSIFGDHSDVMACRQTGFAMLCAASVQEAQDLAAVSHAATLKTRLPFLHFFDGFRTSHEVAKIETLSDDALRALLDEAAVAAHRRRALTPDAPTVRGTAQNPDTYFQAREGCNPYYDACPGVVREVMKRFGELTGRRYDLFEYVGHPEAERVVVLMGSGIGAVEETVQWLVARGEKVGAVKVRLYRPFDVPAFLAVVPRTARSIAVLDRTKEPGAGDPLWLDVIAAFSEGRRLGLRDGAVDPVIVAGRYGLSSKEFTPAMVRAIYDELAKSKPASGFTVGIEDDITHRSLKYDPSFSLEADDVVRAVFFGLGSDGTVGSNKNTIKIIGEGTEQFAQGYFVYDSRKSGSTTVSHVRFSPRPIHSTYLVGEANFVACHHPQFLERYDVAELAQKGATLLLNASWKPEEVWERLPKEVQTQIVEKEIKVYVLDAFAIAEEVGLGRTLGTVMQAAFFVLSGVLPRDKAIEQIKKTIKKSYGKRGDVVVNRNYQAVDLAVERVAEVPVPGRVTTTRARPPVLSHNGKRPPSFVEKLTAVLVAGKGDLLPVSAFPADGTWPVGTGVFEKRSIAQHIPEWDPKICIQCNKCSLICPHAALRTTVFDPEQLEKAPAGFVATPYKGKEHAGKQYVVQVAPDDCTGCGLCVAFCPAKDKSNPKHKAIDMVAAEEKKPAERERFAFVNELPVPDRKRVHLDVKGSQLLDPLFEFSGACAGCGETPYVKLLTQLFGDRTVIANATGCSSIYGGNLPTTPYRTNSDGRGPAWGNSLFEDNAEYGLGIRLALDHHRDHAARLLKELSVPIGEELVKAILEAKQDDETGLAEQRARVALLRDKLRLLGDGDVSVARTLDQIADYLVRKNVWIVGGDGWAYDIGFGGLDHVFATGLDLNVLVLDTEVYSNTGGQQSKATPTGAAAKFAAAGKEVAKKDLALIAMSYGQCYVARVAMGAKDKQTVDAFREAESWHGPSLILAYSHCIAHGYDLAQGADQQRLAVESGVWPLVRFDPRRLARGEAPLTLDSPSVAKSKVAEYMRNEGRFRVVELQDPKRFARLVAASQEQAERRLSMYAQLAGLKLPFTQQAPQVSGEAE
ncbi:MAG: pyruvate:ferredoxin (flavodoxin) oxidoreductase [Deltaproteobacteria bacterium]|nr:pyruvate:ferredoxin (flavodoxin) oxidoreductase [Deltaproteobacteria bacterium]